MSTPTLEELLARAEAGEVEAQHMLGNGWQQGTWGSPDIDKAIEWYGKASAAGHGDASFNLGLIGLRILPGMNRPPRPDLAVPALERACERGDEQAHCLLGEALLTGEGGVATDPERGVDLLEKIAHDGSTMAMNCLGGHLMDGRYLPQDQRRANGWFKRAARAGDARGTFNLAISLLGGLGVARDETLARKLLRRAAEQAFPLAMYNYAATLLEGRGGPADVVKGTEWLMRAADAGDATAQYEAGQAFRLGRGVPEDAAKAVGWYGAAARQGHAEALFSLGLCHEHGIGTPRDPAAAEQCYQHAAMKGHAGAAHNLGILFVQGQGVAQDVKMAEELFEYAISCGDDAALFSMGLLHANTDRPETAYVWGLLSRQRQPEGQGQALLDHLETRLDHGKIRAAEERARSWERPDKAMAFMVQRPPGSAG